MIAVEDPDRNRDLDAIAHTLAQSRTTGSLAVGEELAAPGQAGTSCCGPTVLETCCEPQFKEDCCGDLTAEPPSRCGCQ